MDLAKVLKFRNLNLFFFNNFISMSIYYCKGPNFKQFKRGFEKLRGMFCIFQYFTKLPWAMNRISNICLSLQQCESIFETCSESTHTEKYGNMFGYCKEVNLFDQWWLLLATCVGKYYTTILLVLYYTTIPITTSTIILYILQTVIYFPSSTEIWSLRAHFC